MSINNDTEYEITIYNPESNKINKSTIYCYRIDFKGSNVIFYDEYDSILLVLNQFVSISNGATGVAVVD